MQSAIQRFGLVAAALAFAVSPVSAQITAAVAANAQFAMEEMRRDCRHATGLEVETVYGASGRLATQIRNGAPFDVFVSADLDFPDSLCKWGYALPPAKIYAYGNMILWIAGNPNRSEGLRALEDSAVRKIALADPRSAPYGREAVNALRRSGVYARVEKKLVFGESVAQVNQYMFSGNVDAGFTAESMMLSARAAAAETAAKGKWMEVDTTLYDRLAQGAVVTKYGADRHAELSKRFLAYLGSAPARAILSKYGYALP